MVEILRFCSEKSLAAYTLGAKKKAIASYKQIEPKQKFILKDDGLSKMNGSEVKEEKKKRNASNMHTPATL